MSAEQLARQIRTEALKNGCIWNMNKLMDIYYDSEKQDFLQAMNILTQDMGPTILAVVSQVVATDEKNTLEKLFYADN